MLMVDTSVWIAYFRHLRTELPEWLSEGLVHRKLVLADLNALPQAELASNEEVFQLLDDRKLWGRGLGWIDAHLLASALLSGCRFRTLDLKLAQAATALGLA